MTESDRWIVVDTETTGLRNPIYPVEIAAQAMQGWNPIGSPIRLLLNFNVPIEPAAEKLHGYSRKYLRKNGLKPAEAMSVFCDYVGSAPIVSYNLAFDWNRVLSPTLDRMHLQSQLRSGFCALQLTRYVVQGMRDYKFNTVIKTFGIANDQAHHAQDDVSALVRFLSEYIGPHLEKSNIIGFAKVTKCARGREQIPPLEFSAITKKENQDTMLTKEDIFSIGELVGICRAIVMDGKITNDELNFLAAWLERCPRISAKPIARMHNLVSDIIADGLITSEEVSRLSVAIDDLISTSGMSP